MQANESGLTNLLATLSEEDYCYLTTRGRKTGNPHEIEIWFVVIEKSIYIMSGNMEKSDWVRNSLQEPQVTVRIAESTFNASARIVDNKDIELIVRNLMADKYNEREKDGSLSGWAQTALVVAFDTYSLI